MSQSLDKAEKEAREARAALAAAAERVQQLNPNAVVPTHVPTPVERDIGGQVSLSIGGNGKHDDDDDEKLKAPPNDPFADGFGPYLAKSLHELLFTSPLNVLLICTPFAFIAKAQEWNDVWIFIFALLAIAPFAERLSFVTEQLAMYTSETLGGLLNATFGNVTELIVSLFALQAGLYRIVQVSLIGSILSNLLLVLGTAFLVGGLKHPEQRFNKTAQTASFGLLLLSVMCIMFPMVLDQTHETFDDESTLLISRLTSVCMLATYALYLCFQLFTHTHMFQDDDDDDDDGEERVLGMWGSIFWLAFITVFISYLSEYMVDAIRGAAEDLHVPDLFLGTIIIPIVGNAAEHAAAIIFAHKNKMEVRRAHGSCGARTGARHTLSLLRPPLRARPRLHTPHQLHRSSHLPTLSRPLLCVPALPRHRRRLGDTNRPLRHPDVHHDRVGLRFAPLDGHAPLRDHHPLPLHHPRRRAHPDGRVALARRDHPLHGIRYHLHLLLLPHG